MSLGANTTQPVAVPRSRLSAVVDRVGEPLAWTALVLLAVHDISSYDIWWQLAAGEWILTHGLPSSDPFSFGFPDRPWIEPRWLYCVALHVLRQVIGLNGLIVAKVLLLLATFSVVRFSVAPRRVDGAWIAVVLGVVAMHERFMVRPELVSFFALALLVTCIERYRSSGRVAWIATLPLLQLAWCNLHTLWILGPATLWIYTLAELAQAYVVRLRPNGLTAAPTSGIRLRGLALVAGLCSAAALANPYLFRGVTFPLLLFQELGSSHLLGRSIAEFLSPLGVHWARADHRTLGFIAVVLISALPFIAKRRTLRWGRLAVWLAFLFLALRAQRNVALFGLVAATFWVHGSSGLAMSRCGLASGRGAVGGHRCVLSLAGMAAEFRLRRQ